MQSFGFFFFHENFFPYKQDPDCLFKVIATRGRPFFFFNKIKNFVFSMQSFGFFFFTGIFSPQKGGPCCANYRNAIFFSLLNY